jgi:hypothetical protein
MFVDTTVDPWVYSGGMWWAYEWDPQTDDAEIVLTQHADDFLKGNHSFRFGVQYKQGSANTKLFNTSYYYQAESYYYSYYYGYGYYYTWQGMYLQPPFYYGAKSDSIGAFVSDSWQVSDRLTLELGVRYDNHQVRVPDYPRLDMDSNPTGEIIEGRDMVDWTSFDPRFGFAWQPTDSGRTVVRGAIGRFHAGSVFGQWYWPPPEMPPLEGYWLNWDGEWEQTWTWVASDGLLVDDTENADTWEYSLGVEHQVGANSTFGVQAVYKKTKNLIGWHILDDAEYDTFSYTDPWTQQVFELHDYGEQGPTTMKGNSSGPGANGGDRPYQQEYQGLIFTYKKRFSNNWDMLASYTYSKSEGLNPSFLDWGSQGYVMTPTSTLTRPSTPTAGTWSGWSRTTWLRGRSSSAPWSIIRSVGPTTVTRGSSYRATRGNLPRSSPSRPATTSGSRTSWCGISASASTSRSARERTSASTCRFSTSSTTMRSRAGGAASSIPTTILCPVNGSTLGGPSCA